MKEWIEKNAGNVLTIGVVVVVGACILISEIRDIKREIKYVKEESAREIEYLTKKIENNRRESDQKWVEVYKEIIDLRKDMNKEERK